MNYNKSIVLCLLLFTSNIMNAGMISKVFTTGIVLYIHQNVMTKQDLTKTPHITPEEITAYINKCSATIMNTRTSLQPFFKVIEESLKAKAAEVSKDAKSIEEEEKTESKKK